MGYSVYEDLTGLNRFSGYGVPAYCDMPGCVEEIHRGVGWRCESYFEYDSCGMQFCRKHFDHETHGDNVVWDGLEHPDWVNQILTDESWTEWRKENPERVAGLL